MTIATGDPRKNTYPFSPSDHNNEKRNKEEREEKKRGRERRKERKEDKGKEKFHGNIDL